MALFSPLMTFTERMLDVTTVRHRVISNNIANLNTPNFNRSEVTFKDALETIKKSEHMDLTDLAAETAHAGIDEALLQNISLDKLYERAVQTSTNDNGINFALGDAHFNYNFEHHPSAGFDELLHKRQKKAISRSDVIASVQPTIVKEVSSSRQDGNNVNPELEISGMIQNSSFYNVLVGAIAGEFRTLKQIISAR